MTAKQYEIEDDQWEQIKELFPQAKTGRPGKDNREMFNAILWLARSGAAWRDLPERYGSWKTVYSRFCKWRDDGTLETIFHALNVEVDAQNIRSLSKPTSTVQGLKGAVNAESNQHIGVSRGGHTTNIHAVVDALGNPIHFQLSAGNVHDAKVATEVLSHVHLEQSNVVSDKAYGTQEIASFSRIIKPRIPFHPNQTASIHGNVTSGCIKNAM